MSQWTWSSFAFLIIKYYLSLCPLISINTPVLERMVYTFTDLNQIKAQLHQFRKTLFPGAKDRINAGKLPPLANLLHWQTCNQCTAHQAGFSKHYWSQYLYQQDMLLCLIDLLNIYFSLEITSLQLCNLLKNMGF